MLLSLRRKSVFRLSLADDITDFGFVKRILFFYDQKASCLSRFHNNILHRGIFLLKLGFIGLEFKDAREVMLSKLSGNGSFKTGNGRKSEPEGV